MEQSNIIVPDGRIAHRGEVSVDERQLRRRIGAGIDRRAMIVLGQHKLAIDNLLFYPHSDIACLWLDFDLVYDGLRLHRVLLLIVKALNRLGRVVHRYRVTGRLRAAPGPIIDRFFGGRDCFFVQVGSNDGVTADPLHDLIKANPRWRGIFIEPLEDCFSKLVANYGAESRFAFEQIAIAESPGERPFYSLSASGIRETGIPASFNVFSSLDRD
jgi:hypothetical protein